jgi:hypothetical protein
VTVDAYESRGDAKPPISKRRDPEPRLLTQGQAAAYCGVCAAVFKQACPVQPIRMLDRIARYDRHALDRWIDSFEPSRPSASIEEADLKTIWNAGNRHAHQGH